MANLVRRTALVSLGAASAVLATRAAQAQPQSSGPQTTTLGQGARQVVRGEGPSIIPGYKAVRLRDVIVEPGGKIDPGPMHPMICHMAQGELEVTRTNPNETFQAKQYHVWTCGNGMTEAVVNKGREVAIMRITDLLA
jgi:hypothetical protein